MRYDDPSGRFWVQYDVRHNGDQKEVDLVDNPIGDVLPSFTVHDARAGVTLFRSDSGMTHRIAFAVTNLTNELYAEFSNAAFFRPEPKRNFVVNYEISF
ncbi:MAG: TonB-dependent receptor [Gemmatimonadetes bacterium]|nr:MAG: TonB-dependent receptor [Gemmatimonadota bacterium]